jgi:hypothetical protein
MNNESKALELATELDEEAANHVVNVTMLPASLARDASAELRRQHAEIESLRAQLADVTDNYNNLLALVYADAPQFVERVPDVDVDDLRDRLVAISSFVADSNHEASQAMIGDTLAMLSAAPSQQAAPVQQPPELSDSQIMAEVGRCGLGFSDTRPLGQQWETVCELIRRICARQQAPAQGEPVLRHRVRVHLANRYSYSHKEFCEKLEEIMNEACQREVAQSEPVAQWQKKHQFRTADKWESTNEHDAKWWRDNSQGWEIRALYTHPQQAREPMTLREIADATVMFAHVRSDYVIGIARAVERHHQIKGETMSLTDEQIDEITDAQWGDTAKYLHAAYRAYARAIESAATAPLLKRIAELEKALKLVQQHHATAWNRGHIAGMAANRMVARDAMKAVEQDAWNNTQLTKALMDAEKRSEELERELEALRKDAADADRMCKALAAVIDKDDARWKFLHTPHKDTEGFEWCVMRVKWENGRISEAWHTNQDLKDLDAAIDAAKENP